MPLSRYLPRNLRKDEMPSLMELTIRLTALKQKTRPRATSRTVLLNKITPLANGLKRSSYRCLQVGERLVIGSAITLPLRYRMFRLPDDSHPFESSIIARKSLLRSDV
jgi:hypothetical protein